MIIIELTEYQSIDIARSKIDFNIIDRLQQRYSSQLKVNSHYKKGNDCWRFTAQGWVGYIPVASDFGIRIKPKVPIKNLLAMLEYAYNLKSFNFLDGLIHCNTLEEFYNRLAQILVECILVKCRQGLYKTYISKKDKLSYIRGRLDIRETILKPWDIKLACHYNEQTQDIIDNQILLWALYCISHSKICNQEVQTLVRKAYHALAKSISLISFTGKDCLARQYNRLNQDYEQLHLLCRFFIDRCMPTYKSGNYQTIPFLVNMAALYEKFVAEWLKINLPDEFQLKIKQKVNLNPIGLEIDLLICRRKTGKIHYVLDTKYKCAEKPSNSDFNQVVTYAISQDCNQAILIYPQALTNSLNTDIGNINVCALTFDLDKNLEQAGKDFIQDLFDIESKNILI